MAEPIYATYTGGGCNGYLAGLPACDMTHDQWAAQDVDLRALALKLDLYTLPDATVARVEPAAPADPAQGAA